VPILAMLTLGAACGASAQSATDLTKTTTYTYKTVNVAGEANTSVMGLNASGAYTGEACNLTCTNIKLFVTNPSGKQTFFLLPFDDYSPTAGPNNEGVKGIDNAGDVVGSYLDSKGSAHGFERLASGKMIEINDPAAADVEFAGTDVKGISFDGSVIVGSYVDSNDVVHGFLLKGGIFTTYDFPNAVLTVVTFYDYNQFGGTYLSSTGAYFGFYVDASGTPHTISAPGKTNPAKGNGTYLLGISPDGILFGDVISTTKPFAGFADSAGSFIFINDPLEVGTRPLDGTFVDNVSPAGDPVGFYSYTQGNAEQGVSGLFYGFIATPTSSN